MKSWYWLKPGRPLRPHPHAIKLRHALERAVQPVIPSVIGTMQNRRLAARLGHHRRRMMPAHVVKRSQHAIAAPHSDDGLARNGCGHKLSRLCHLRSPAQHLPRLRKNRLPLQFGNALIHIPRRRNRRSFRQRRIRPIAGAIRNLLPPLRSVTYCCCQVRPKSSAILCTPCRQWSNHSVSLCGSRSFCIKS